MLEALFSIHIIGPLKCDPPSPHPSSPPPQKNAFLGERKLYMKQIPLLILIINFTSRNLKNFTHPLPPPHSRPQVRGLAIKYTNTQIATLHF